MCDESLRIILLKNHELKPTALFAKATCAGFRFSSHALTVYISTDSGVITQGRPLRMEKGYEIKKSTVLTKSESWLRSKYGKRIVIEISPELPSSFDGSAVSPSLVP